MPDPKSTAWQIPYFVGDDWEQAIQEIKKLRKFAVAVSRDGRNGRRRYGYLVDYFATIPTPHEMQQAGVPVAERIHTALDNHQCEILRLMNEDEVTWDEWRTWKSHALKAYERQHSRLDPCVAREWQRTCMNGYTFSDPVDFSDRRLAEASFDDATFSGPVCFDEAVFYGTLSFERATFSEVPNFVSTYFFSSSSFNGAIFSEPPNFAGADFQTGPSFNGVIFDEIPDFSKAKIHGSLSFDGATFTREVYIDSWQKKDGLSKGELPIEASYVGATFSRRAFFDGSVFSAEAQFARAVFKDDVDFTNVAFQDIAGFDGATFEKSAQFKNAEFQEITSFRNANFAGKANFESAKFLSETIFIDAKFQLAPIFRGAKFHPSMAFTHGIGLWDQFSSSYEEGASERFRTLKSYYKAIEAHFEANLFFALEMRATMREERKAGKWRRAALIFAYDQCTAFGLSVFRPLACWLAVQLLLTITLVWFSPADLAPINSVIDSISLAFLNSLALPGLVDSNLFASQIASVFQIGKMSAYDTMYEFNHRFPGMALALGLAKVFSIVFAFLTLLALRNRFRIK